MYIFLPVFMLPMEVLCHLRFLLLSTHDNLAAPATNATKNWNRHGLDVQHVGAVAVQIEGKVRETGFKVDVDGCCWASSPASTDATAVKAAMVETADQSLGVSTNPCLPKGSNHPEGWPGNDDRPRSHWQLRQRRPQLTRGQQRQGDSLSRAHADGDDYDDDEGGSNASINNTTGSNAAMRLGRNADNSYGVEGDDEEPFGNAFFCRTGAAGGGQCGSDNRSLRRQRRLQREGEDECRYQSEEVDERTPFLGLGMSPINERTSMPPRPSGTGVTMCRRCTWPAVLTAVPNRREEGMLEDAGYFDAVKTYLASLCAKMAQALEHSLALRYVLFAQGMVCSGAHFAEFTDVSFIISVRRETHQGYHIYCKRMESSRNVGNALSRVILLTCHDTLSYPPSFPAPKSTFSRQQ